MQDGVRARERVLLRVMGCGGAVAPTASASACIQIGVLAVFVDSCRQVLVCMRTCCFGKFPSMKILVVIIDSILSITTKVPSDVSVTWPSGTASSTGSTAGSPTTNKHR